MAHWVICFHILILPCECAIFNYSSDGLSLILPIECLDIPDFGQHLPLDLAKKFCDARMIHLLERRVNNLRSKEQIEARVVRRESQEKEATPKK